MVRQLLLVAALLAAASPAAGQGGAESGNGILTLKFGPAVFHYSKDPEHNNRPWLFGADWERESLWSIGGVMFNNSFDQRSQYLYVGKRWFPAFTPERVYLKLTGGVLLGYKDPYHNKIPLNHRRGIAPALLPAVGYQMQRSRVQVVPLGTAGLLLTFGVSL